MAHLTRNSKPVGLQVSLDTRETACVLCTRITLGDSPMPAARRVATLEPVRFGEFLRDRALITEDQWLAALAEHWSSPVRRPIGSTIVARGYLSREIVEAEARVFHDDLEVVEVCTRRDKPTVRLATMPF
jgi:hypothetical protein